MFATPLTHSIRSTCEVACKPRAGEQFATVTADCAAHSLIFRGVPASYAFLHIRFVRRVNLDGFEYPKQRKQRLTKAGRPNVRSQVNFDCHNKPSVGKLLPVTRRAMGS